MTSAASLTELRSFFVQFSSLVMLLHAWRIHFRDFQDMNWPITDLEGKTMAHFFRRFVSISPIVQVSSSLLIVANINESFSSGDVSRKKGALYLSSGPSGAGQFGVGGVYHQ